MNENGPSVPGTPTPGSSDHRIRKVIVTAGFALLLTTVGHAAPQQDASAKPHGVTALALYDMAHAGQAEAALQFVVKHAEKLGGWAAAPGDGVAFDPHMDRRFIGANPIVDYPPASYTYNANRPVNAIDNDYLATEQTVAFGLSLFSTPTDTGELPRPCLDDILAAYIEEVGHSWQEYYYETRGLGEGPRTHKSTSMVAMRLAPGREYQIKSYILSLDGTLLHLSDELATNLRAQICQGYANPIGHDVLSYDPPPGWASPRGLADRDSLRRCSGQMVQKA